MKIGLKVENCYLKGAEKMAIGFRKSLFGFNTADVVDYIDKMHTAFQDKQTLLNKELESLNGELSLSKENYDLLLKEKDEIAARLNEFEEKYAEIQRLSEVIGKLYLVAQANAKAIIERTSENSRITNEEITKNLIAIDEAQSSLSSLKEQLNKTSDGFLNEIDSLLSSLKDVKNQVEENCQSAKLNEEEFEAVFESLTEK